MSPFLTADIVQSLGSSTGPNVLVSRAAALDQVGADALAGFARHGVWVEVSTPVIPGFSADADAIRRTADHVLAALGPDAPWFCELDKPLNSATATAAFGETMLNAVVNAWLDELKPLLPKTQL